MVFRLSFFFLVVKSDPIYWPTDWSINLIDWSIKTRQFILIGFVVVIVVLINCLYIEIESLRSLRFKISSHLNMSILSIESWNRSVVVVVNYFIQNDFLILFWCLLLNWTIIKLFDRKRYYSKTKFLRTTYHHYTNTRLWMNASKVKNLKTWQGFESSK